MIVENQIGKGRAVYLNLAMHDYGKYRLTPPRGDAFRDLFAGALRNSGITAAVQVINPEDGSSVPCVEVWRYKGDDGNYVALMRNPEFQAASLKQASYPDNSAIEQTVHVQVLMNGSVIGETHLDPWSPLILKLPSDPVTSGTPTRLSRAVETRPLSPWWIGIGIVVTLAVGALFVQRYGS
jgi:hypothetical protein